MSNITKPNMSLSAFIALEKVAKGRHIVNLSPCTKGAIDRFCKTHNAAIVASDSTTLTFEVYGKVALPSDFLKARTPDQNVTLAIIAELEQVAKDVIAGLKNGTLSNAKARELLAKVGARKYTPSGKYAKVKKVEPAKVEPVKAIPPTSKPAKVVTAKG